MWIGFWFTAFSSCSVFGWGVIFKTQHVPLTFLHFQSHLVKTDKFIFFLFTVHLDKKTKTVILMWYFRFSFIICLFNWVWVLFSSSSHSSQDIRAFPCSSRGRWVHQSFNTYARNQITVRHQVKAHSWVFIQKLQFVCSCWVSIFLLCVHPYSLGHFKAAIVNILY